MPASANALRRSAHLLQRLTVAVADGRDAREGVLEGQVRPRASTSALLRLANGVHHLEPVIERQSGQIRRSRRGTRGCCRRRDCLRASPGRSCGRRAGRTIRRSWPEAAGCVLAGRRPRRGWCRRGCPSPRRSSGRRRRRRLAARRRQQGADAGPIGERVQEPSEVRLLDLLPGQAEADVQRLNNLSPAAPGPPPGWRCRLHRWRGRRGHRAVMIAPVDAPRCAGLPNHDLGEVGERRSAGGPRSIGPAPRSSGCRGPSISLR